MLIRLALLNLALLLLLWGVERTVGERQWLGLVLTCAPQPLFLLPTVLLALMALARRHRSALLVTLAAGAFGMVVLLGFRWPLPAPHPRPHHVRVMTYNVEGWAPGTAGVVRAIRQKNPDVVCLEEADDNGNVPGHAPHDFQRALPDYRVINHGEIILASRLPVRAVTTVPLPPGPDSRPAVVAVVDAEGQALTVIAVHLLPNQFDQHLWPPADLHSYADSFAVRRDAQDTALLSALSRVRTPFIVGGDFNAQPQTRSCRRLTRLYADAFDQAGRGLGETIPSQFPLMRIDHILSSRDVAATRAWVPNIRGSDHRPTVADLTFVPSRPGH